MSGAQYWNRINKLSGEVYSLMNEYWHRYSDFGNWQFWVILFTLLAPLIVLLMKLERKRTFEILFFGYTVHMFWTYTDIALIRRGFIDHNYFLMPFLPQGLGITASLLPVSFMLLYQYCLKRNKNFIVWVVGLSAVFAFCFAPIEKLIGFLSMAKGFTIVHIFFIDIIIAMIAYGMTYFFIKFYIKLK